MNREKIEFQDRLKCYGSRESCLQILKLSMRDYPICGNSVIQGEIEGLPYFYIPCMLIDNVSIFGLIGTRA